MIILLDANLSWRLKTALKPFFEDIRHVESAELKQPPKDIEIWEYAKTINATIFTNDEDFYKLSVLKGFPPKIVIFRTGNQSNSFITQTIMNHIDEIRHFIEKSEYGILEII